MTRPLVGTLSRRRFLRQAALAVAGGGLFGPGCAGDPDLSLVDADAWSLHRESLVLDLHVDSILWTRLFGYDLCVEHRNRLPLHPFGWHVDAPRAAEGGLDAGVMGLVINPDEVRPELMFALKTLAWWEDGHGIEQTLATLDLLSETALRCSDRFRLVRSGSELVAAVGDGRLVGIAGLEGSHGLGAELESLELAWERSLRMLGLVHFQATEAGYPMTVEAFDGQGLTDHGRDLIAESARLGVVVDLAHLNAAGVDDALDALDDPFVVSHSACSALHDHPRNLTDDQLQKIGDAGGVIGIAVGRSFLGWSGGVEAFLDHVEHAVQHAGIEGVAIGSDWDGFIVPVSGMADVRSLPALTGGLLARGWPPDDVARFLGGNAVRVLTDVCG